MREMRKRFASIAEVMGAATRRLGLKARLNRYGIWDQWQRIVGPAIAAHARPSRWQGTALVVRVAHPVWVQELTLLKPQLLEQIRGKLPKATIDDIRFESGELPPLPQEEERAAFNATHRELNDRDREVIAEALRPLKDEELREAARRAMQKGLTTTRT